MVENKVLRRNFMFWLTYISQNIKILVFTEVYSKLPKLVITKFKGTHLDWTRFWNELEAEIDSANIPQITRFSYLKEMLHSNVRLSIDSLPFSSEDYEWAKNILKSKYGKSSEVINAHIQEIMGLSIVNGTNPKIIHELYFKLVTHVQALGDAKYDYMSEQF